MTNKEMIKRDCSEITLSNTGAIQCANVGQYFAFAQLMEAGQMLPKGTTIEGATVAMIAGASLGLNVFQSVQGITCINGRPSVWGDALVALVRGSGLLEDEKVEYIPNARDCQGVRVIVKRKGVATPTEGFFSKVMAEKAGLWGKTGPWSAYPVRMLMTRARAYAYRDAFADVLKGIRSAEEEEDIARGVVVDAEPVAEVEQAKPRKRASASALLTDEPKTIVASTEAVTEEVKADVSVLPNLI